MPSGASKQTVLYISGVKNLCFAVGLQLRESLCSWLLPIRKPHIHRQGVAMYILGMRTRIFCLAPASQCPTEAARARALSTDTVREPRDFLRMTEVTLPFGDY